MQAHDRIERALAAGGDFADIRDGAAKAAENVARLAALFHVLAHGPCGAVDAEAIHAAATVIAWHLHEARRLLSDLDTPTDLVAAIRLDAWLIAEARRCGNQRIPTPRVYQFGPGCVRDAKAMKTALALLAERGRARMEEDGKRRFVAVNQALVSVVTDVVGTPGLGRRHRPGGLATAATPASVAAEGSLFNRSSSSSSEG